MKNIVSVIFIVVVLTLALIYIIKQKRSGTKCIGCPLAKTCMADNKKNCCDCDRRK